MVDKSITDADKVILLSALELKRASLNRAINNSTSGSALVKALYVDRAALEALISKVGVL